MKSTCGIFTNIAPLYSRPLWMALNASKDVDYSFYSSQTGFSGIQTIDKNESRFLSRTGEFNWHFLKNLFIGKILIYQVGIISECFRTDYDAYILSGEMYTLSNWIAAFICKVRKKPLLFWGHGFYGDEIFIKRIFRKLYFKIADYHLVYGNRSRDLMINSGFSPDKIYVVYNSLDYYTHKKLYEERSTEDLDNIKINLFPTQSNYPVIIFIGRLTKEKKISYLLEAVSRSKKKGNIFNCLIVGGGNESENLKNLSVKLGLNESVCFYGPSYDENINAKLIMLSQCCVSPGNVGLTAIHSLAFGTPVITHRNYFNQGPEVEAVIQNKTGLFYDENDVDSLSLVIEDIILNSKKLLMESNCIEQVMQFWNPMTQAAVFSKAVINSIEANHPIT
jgi:glycosyltransferase involved in cell wall biosynthesis